jgi:hypothetical protein
MNWFRSASAGVCLPAIALAGYDLAGASRPSSLESVWQ